MKRNKPGGVPVVHQRKIARTETSNRSIRHRNIELDDAFFQRSRGRRSLDLLRDRESGCAWKEQKQRPSNREVCPFITRMN